MQEIIESVGIDIGTSTTQLIFSRLVMENLTSGYSVPKITIVDKEITYRSSIYTTPLRSETEIDAKRVSEIVRTEYQHAGKRPEDIQTGAVIITGETARKKNASAMLEALSAMAGEFVVATAGPDLESVLSARGAGTDTLSAKERCTVANLDIGGGTTNIALFHKGTLAGVSCLDIGGRLIKLQDGKITYIYQKIAALADEHGISVKTGDRADIGTLEKICGLMADQLAQALHLKRMEPDHQQYYTNKGKPLGTEPEVQAVTFSGGVADFVYEPGTEDVFRFNDIGILLGRAVAMHPAFRNIRTFRAKETIRATVIGAGNHTTEVSGSTISYNIARFPIKNIPIVRVEIENETTAEGVIESLQRQIPMYFAEGKPEQLALALSGNGWTSFREIQKLAESICAGGKAVLESEFPLIVILEQDIGKVLGNALRYRLGNEKEIICLDSIAAKSGDYIDIGVPVANGRVIPVIIKTLIMNS
ncbi:ethanolamine ammonia-lyase reactivating factor EutA [Anaerotruncus rubiinfantis]|uniref:ethanolamine ammonia-lyase reactivating factor EutA n=1 Tax=Anaerotruncus rubiinfantis TaxID=1720200 RepID=UPI00082B0BA9|nr:ethanolamine ammonia-lyase reactivating factor EutA [Anaerotruncus rubiinfantis]